MLQTVKGSSLIALIIILIISVSAIGAYFVLNNQRSTTTSTVDYTNIVLPERQIVHGENFTVELLAQGTTIVNLTIGLESGLTLKQVPIDFQTVKRQTNATIESVSEINFWNNGDAIISASQSTLSRYDFVFSASNQGIYNLTFTLNYGLLLGHTTNLVVNAT